MKPFEFVIVIISIIIGLAFTEFAKTIVLMIKNYKTAVFSLPYILIMLTGWVGGLNYWATIYMTRKVQLWDNQKMGLLFVTSLSYYVIAGTFLPDANSFTGNYIELYHEVIDISLITMISWIILIMAESYLFKKGRPFFWYIIMILFILLMLSGIIVDNRTFRETLAYILFVLQLINLIASKIVIGDKLTDETK